MNNAFGISKKEILLKKINDSKKSIKPHMDFIILYIRDSIIDFIDLYKAYPFVVLFVLFILVSIILDYSIFYIFLSFVILAILTLANKFIDNSFTKFELEHDFSTCNKELDLLITSCLQEYIVMNGLTEKKYFTESEETKIRNEITTMVTSKISKKLIYELGHYYNENAVTNIIGTRIYLLITQITVYTNTQQIPVETTESNSVNLMDLYNNLAKKGLVDESMNNIQQNK